jgi:hypothetical protein
MPEIPFFPLPLSHSLIKFPLRSGWQPWLGLLCFLLKHRTFSNMAVMDSVLARLT